MKNCILLLLAMFVAIQAFGQIKDKEPKVKPETKVKTNPKDLHFDSLTTTAVTFSGQVDSLLIVTDSLSTQLDSVSKERTIYYGLYTTIKEKVLKHDFDPAKFSSIIDSMAAGRDAKYSGLTAASVSLMDSLTVLKRENQQIKAAMSGITSEEAAKNRLANELRLLKELLDSKVLTQIEFNEKKEILLQKWQ